MNTLYPQKYPVFEADQVLSQHHLNQIVTYLEQQDRLTRKGAIGVGIVCGMDFSFPTNRSLHISCGQAITSLGYMMDVEAKTFTHFRNITLPQTFLAPDLSVETYLKEILHFTSPYQKIKNCIELLPGNSPAADKEEIPAGFFEDKIILQLLEVDFIDQKNCLTANCEDKGKRLEFTLRTILITEEQAEDLAIQENETNFVGSRIDLPRYNVPFKNLNGPQQVMAEFKKIFNLPTIQKISNKVKEIFNACKEDLDNKNNLLFLQNIAPMLQDHLEEHQNTVQVQYLWDWISDITDAYHEIIYLKRPLRPSCCVSPAKFPFHVVIGGKGSNVRTSFYPVQDIQDSFKQYSFKLNLLFDRLATLVQQWNIPNSGIRITPSCYGRVALSEKAIPFYYGKTTSLLQQWNAEITGSKRFQQLTGYQQNADHNQLLSDLEDFNFFRIEGHIGNHYKTGLEKIQLLRKTYNLPFQVTALNAVDSRNKVMDIMNFKGRWDDLETDYDIARKRIFNITEFVIKFIESRKAVIISQTLMTEATITQLQSILKNLKETLPIDLYEFLPEHDDFIKLFKQLNEIFLFHRFCIQNGKEDLSVLAEDLIDRFDDINHLFLEDPLTVIHDEATFRWQKIYKDLFFSNFIQQHGGIEHQGGVSKGGTFVVVYVDNSIFQTKPRPNIFNGILSSLTLYKKALKVSPAEQLELDAALEPTKFKSKVVTTPVVLTPEKKVELDKAKGNMLDITEKKLGQQFSKEIQSMLMDQIREALDQDDKVAPSDVNFEGEIIADFFLPYYCCGQGNTLEIKLEVPENLSLAMEKLVFCNQDTQLADINIHGALGGTFTGTAAQAIELKNNKHFFNPAHASVKQAKSYTLQYQVNGVTSNLLTLQMEEPINLNWEVKPDGNKINSFVFNNKKEQEGMEYEFDFGDGSPKLKTFENKIIHAFNPGPAVLSTVVNITTVGTTCSNNQKFEINFSNEPTVKDFDPKDFNKNDFNT